MDLLTCAKDIYSGYQYNGRWAIDTFWRRANTLDVFTSDSWLSVQSFDDPLGSGPGDLALTPPDIIPRGNTVEQRFELGDIATNYVFTGGIARILRLDVEAEVAASDAGARIASTLLDLDEACEEAVQPRVGALVVARLPRPALPRSTGVLKVAAAIPLDRPPRPRPAG